MRVRKPGAEWQENEQGEKQQRPEAYTIRTDARHSSRLTTEPTALSVAGLFCNQG